MSSIFYDPDIDYSPPADAITDEEELHNCLILGMSLFLFHVNGFHITELMPTRVIRHHNGKKLLFSNSVGVFLHDIGIKDPTFNTNMGELNPIITFSDPSAAARFRHDLILRKLPK